MSQKGKNSTEEQQQQQQQQTSELNKVEVLQTNKFFQHVNPKISPENPENPLSNTNSSKQQQTREESFFNEYATKKTISNGFLDSALLATNVGQLKVLLSDGFLDTKDPRWWISTVLISVSLVAQIIMLGIFGYLGTSNLADRKHKTYIVFMNNLALFLTGFVFVLNIITNVIIQIDFSNIYSKITTTPSPPLMWPAATDSIFIK